jgi:hypothetical protein
MGIRSMLPGKEEQSRKVGRVTYAKRNIWQKVIAENTMTSRLGMKRGEWTVMTSKEIAFWVNIVLIVMLGINAVATFERIRVERQIYKEIIEVEKRLGELQHEQQESRSNP